MDESDQARHRIGTVSRLTGVSGHALRVWERRYGSPLPERTPAGDRLYSDADIRRLRIVKKLIDLGHSVGDIVRLDEARLGTLLAQHHAPMAEPQAVASATVERYLDALGKLDLERAGRVLTRSAVTLAPRVFVETVAQPLLVAIGDRWQSGELCVAHEHAASAMLRTQLGAILAELRADPDAPAAVVATPSGERHELGALFAAIVAAQCGFRSVYLGPDLPASEIAAAVQASSARVLLLSIVSLSARKARAAMAEIEALLPKRVRVAVGGRGSAAMDGMRDLVTLSNWLMEVRA